MGMGRKSLIAGFAIAMASTIASTAVAEETYDNPTTGVPNNLPDQLEQVSHAYDRDFFRNRSLLRQVDYIFGFGLPDKFPENEISRDGRAIFHFYQDVLARQMSSQTPIRTPDLPTPFNLSVRDIPAVEAATPVPPVPTVEPVAPPVVTPPAQTKPNVPALW